MLIACNIMAMNLGWALLDMSPPQITSTLLEYAKFFFACLRTAGSGASKNHWAVIRSAPAARRILGSSNLIYELEFVDESSTNSTGASTKRP